MRQLSKTVNKGIFATIKRWFINHPGGSFVDLTRYSLKHSQRIINWLSSDPHFAILSFWMDDRCIQPFMSAEYKRQLHDDILAYYPKYYEMDWDNMLPVGTLDDPEKGSN